MSSQLVSVFERKLFLESLQLLKRCLCAILVSNVQDKPTVIVSNHRDHLFNST